MLHIHAATAEDPLPKTYARPSSVGCWFGLGSRFDWVQRPSVRPAESPLSQYVVCGIVLLRAKKGSLRRHPMRVNLLLHPH